jgi:hypothetical protein
MEFLLASVGQSHLAGIDSRGIRFLSGNYQEPLQPSVKISSFEERTLTEQKRKEVESVACRYGHLRWFRFRKNSTVYRQFTNAKGRVSYAV